MLALQMMKTYYSTYAINKNLTVLEVVFVTKGFLADHPLLAVFALRRRRHSSR